jgi:hypothetical protein
LFSCSSLSSFLAPPLPTNQLFKMGPPAPKKSRVSGHGHGGVWLLMMSTNQNQPWSCHPRFSTEAGRDGEFFVSACLL